MFVAVTIYFSKDSDDDTSPNLEYDRPSTRTSDQPQDSFTHQPQDLLELSPKAKRDSTTSTYLTLTKRSFEPYDLGKEGIRGLQRCLLSLGYKPGPDDGILGGRTLAELNQFCKDFCIQPSEDLLDGLLLPIVRNATIAEAHPDLRKIVTSGAIDSWVGSQGADRHTLYKKIWDHGTPKQVILLLNFYKFDRERPAPLPLPQTGIIEKWFSEGLAPLEIKTKFKDNNYFIKLVNTSTEEEVLTAFIRAGETLNVDVPIGSCQLRFANGNTWYGVRFFFGPTTIFSKADTTFVFRQEGLRVAGYTVELYLQRHGNLRTKEMSPFDF